MVVYPSTEAFESASIILPVINETASLRETADIVVRRAGPRLKELLIVVGEKTDPPALAMVAQLKQRLEGLVTIHRQRLPFLGGAVREAFDLARGSHVILMASDLETDPELVGALIARAEDDPACIVTASRWQKEGRFHGYGTVKLACNWAFQRFLSALYATPLSDLTYAYRIFPTALVQAIRWEELRHPFLLETLVKPLRLGVRVREIPAVWRARVAGKSQNTFFRNFAYLRIGLKVRFDRPSTFLRSDGRAHDEGRRCA